MPAIPIILQGILAAIQAAPQIAAVVEAAKNLITSLFTAKVITAEQQKALHDYVDAHAALAAQGIVPEWWTVEADPS